MYIYILTIHIAAGGKDNSEFDLYTSNGERSLRKVNQETTSAYIVFEMYFLL